MNMEEIVIGEYIIVPDKLKLSIEAHNESSYQSYLASGINIIGVKIVNEEIYLELEYNERLVERFWRDENFRYESESMNIMLYLYSIDSRKNRSIYMAGKYYNKLRLVLSEINPENLVVRLLK